MRRTTVLSLLLACAFAGAPGVAARAAQKESGAKTAAKPEATVPASTPTRARDAIGGMPVLPGVPVWNPPAEYAVDMVMASEGQQMTMHRAFHGGDIRSEMKVDDQTMIMIERAAEPGISYYLMPEQKMVMKMNAEAVAEQDAAIMKEHGATAPAKVAAAATPQVEKLGTEKLDGRDAAKFKASAEGHEALLWVDAVSGAPLRMQSGEARVEWKNYQVAAQPAKLFELPKDWQVIDMEEQMKQMRAAMGGKGAAMGGMAMSGGGKGGMKMAGRGAASAALGGMGAAGGLPGGMPGMGGMSLEGMAGQYGQNMGQGFGQQMGASLGASFGGPLGAIAGGYIGGKIGGWIGHRAATAVTPDIGPGSSK